MKTTEFLSGIRDAGGIPLETGDPAEYWSDLMADVELHILKTRAQTDQWLYADQSFDVSRYSRAAIGVLLGAIGKMGEVRPKDAANLSKMYYNTGKVRPCLYCAAVAFELGDRSEFVVDAVKHIGGM